MKNKTFKKSLSVFLAVLMLMSSWVWVPGEHNHVSAVEYQGINATILTNQAAISSFNENSFNVPNPTTTTGKFHGDTNGSSDYVTTENFNNQYKKILYSPAYGSSDNDLNSGWAANFTGISNIDSVRLWYPTTTMIYDGTGINPKMGVLFAVDAASSKQVGVSNVYMSANANGLVMPEAYWHAKSTASKSPYYTAFAHLYLMYNVGASWISTSSSNDKTSTTSKGAWEVNASTIEYQGGGFGSGNTYYKSITPTWTVRSGSNYSVTAQNTIYVIDYVPYINAMSKMKEYYNAIKSEPGKYSTASVAKFKDIANSLIAVKVNDYINASKNDVSGWNTAVSSALSACNSFTLEKRKTELTYDNLISFTDWVNSASSTSAGATLTCDENAGTVTFNGNGTTADIYSNHNGAGGRTNYKNYYAFPVVGGEEYTFTYNSANVSHSTQWYVFWFKEDGSAPTATNVTWGGTGWFTDKSHGGKAGNGVMTQSFTAPSDAAYAEFRIGTSGSTTATATFSNIAFYQTSRADFAANSCVTHPRRKVYTYGDAVGTSFASPTKYGYKFKHWVVDTTWNGYQKDVDTVAPSVYSTTPMNESYNLHSVWWDAQNDVSYDNMFSFSEWATSSCVKGIWYTSDNKVLDEGRISVDAENGSVSLTRYADDYCCNTNLWVDVADRYATALEPNTDYVLEFDLETTYAGSGSIINVCKYLTGGTTAADEDYFAAGKNIKNEFNSGDNTKLILRLGNLKEGTMTVSNIRLYKKSDADKIASITYPNTQRDYGVTDIANLQTPVRPGYVFEGWYTDAACTVAATQADLVNSVNVYSKWTANRYGVLYDNLFDFSKFTLATDTVKEISNRTNSGFTMTSLSGTDANTGFSYAIPVEAGKTYTLTADTEFTKGSGGYDIYIQCLNSSMAGETSATVVGGTGNAGKEGNVYVRISGQTAANPYITFKAGDTTAYVKIRFDANAAGNVLIVNNIRLNEANKVADGISYHLGNNVTYGSAYGTLPTPTKTGYAFVGWKTADGTTVTKDTVVATASDHTLYSSWSPITYTVSFNANGGSGTMSAQTHTYDSSLALTANTLTRTGYTFKNWNTKADGTGTTYINSQSVSNLTTTQGATITLYAQWNINKYTVTFEKADGTTTTQSVEYGKTPVAPNNTDAHNDAAGHHTYSWPDIGAVTGNVTYKEIKNTAEHTEGEPVEENRKASTCTVAGSYESVVYCSVCNEELSRKTVVLELADHTFSAATCTAPKTCSVCGATEGEALGHDYDANGDGEITEEDGVVDPAPTCTAEGVRTYTCKNCSASYTQAVSAKGHTPGAEATCTTAQTCTVCNVTLVAAKGHAYEGKVTTEPTCTEKGVKTFTCKNDASHTYTEEIAATGHTLTQVEAKAPTCGEAGWDAYEKCSECDYSTKVEKPATGAHTYVYVQNADKKTHTGTCSVCSATETGTCSGGTATCTDPAECSICNGIYIEAPGHKPGEAVTENVVAATCHSKGSYDTVVYCSVCNEELSSVTTVVDEVAHTEDNPVTENFVDSTCYEEGSYDEVVYCSVCKAAGKTTVISRLEKTVAKKNHTPASAVKENIKKASCFEGGSYDEVVYCSVEECNAEISKTERTIEKREHNYCDWYYANEADKPTYTKKGTQTRKCTNVADELYVVCEHTDTREVDMLEDSTAPTGTITYKETVWDRFLETITFGIYTSEDVVLTIEATDAESGVAKIEYIISDEVMTKETVMALEDSEWTAYSEADKVTITKADAENKVVYAKLTNTQNGVTYLSTNGITFDLSAPVIESAVNCTYATITVTDANLDKVTVNDNEVELTEGKITVEGVNNYTVVATDKAGNKTEVTVMVKGHTPGAEATCTTAQTCTECKVTLVAALGHKLTQVEAKAATCEAIGWEAYEECSVCDYTTYEEIPAKGHAYEGAVTTAPTCTEKGVMTYTCKNDASHTYTEEIAAKGHTLTQVEAKAATCEAIGWEAYEECSVCDYTTYEEIPAKGHAYDRTKSESNLTRPALVDGKWTNGYYTYKCINDPSHTIKEEVDRASYTAYEAALANLNSLLTTDITEAAKAAINQVITENKVADNLITTEQTVIDAATEKLVQAFGDNNNSLNTYTVTFKIDGSADVVVNVISGHNATAPTDVKKAYDDTYHYTFTGWDTTFTNVTTNLTVTAQFDAIAHSFSTHNDKDDEYHTDVCACGYSKDVKHTETSKVTIKASCYADGVRTYTCSVCGGTRTETIAKRTHHVVDTTVAVEPTCSATGTMNQKCDHVGSDDYEACDYTTTRVMDKVADAHKAEADYTVIQKATCEADGYKAILCEYCDAELLKETIAKREHVYKDNGVQTNATCLADGVMNTICTNVETDTHKACKHESTRAITKLDHSYTGEYKWDNSSTTKTHSQKCVNGCNEYGNETDCTFDKVVTAPTCYNGGYTTYTCSVCKNSYNADNVAKREHDYVYANGNGTVHEVTCKYEDCKYTATENCSGGTATCTEKATCEKCLTAWGNNDSNNHVGYNTEVSRTPSTCNTKGSVTKKCACGDTKTTALELDASNHEGYNEEVSRTPSTCNTKGSVTKKCACGDEKTTELDLDASNHEGYNTEVSRTPSTCNTKGSVTMKCACGDTKTTELDLDASNHEGYNEEVSRTPSTCKTKGSVTMKCACGDTKTTALELNASNHEGEAKIKKNYKDATCTSEGYTGDIHWSCCDVLATKGTTTEMIPHMDSADDDNHLCDYGCGTTVEECLDGDDNNHDCDICGKENVSDHNWKDADCTTPKTCYICGATEGTALSHDYVSVVTKEPSCGENGIRTYTCKNDASHTYTEVIKATGEHNYVNITVIKEATCVSEGIIEKACGCGAKIQETTSSVNHKWEEEGYTVKGEEATCISNGIKRYDCVYKEYGCTAYRADTLEKTDHTYAVDTEGSASATCTNNGYIRYKCTVENCIATYDEFYKVDVNGEYELDAEGEKILLAPATGHNYKNTVIAPTCDKEGYTLSVCKECEYTFIDGLSVVPAKGHTDKNNDGMCDDCTVNIVGSCKCLCHSKNWLLRIIYVIIRFISKLLGVNKECACGVIHY